MRALFLVLLITASDPIKENKTSVLILARGGSKGVPLKNIQQVGGLSLLARAVQAARTAGFDVTVSTDHPAVALEAIRSGADTCHRSKVTASDWAPSIWGAQEYVFTRPDIQILMLLQATSPFIRARDLRKAVEKIQHPKAFDCVFSVTRSFKLRWNKSNGIVSPINFNISARPRRQDWNGELIETGAFYITRRHLIEAGRFQNYNCTVYEVPHKDSLEVDTTRDLRIADFLLRSNLN